MNVFQDALQGRLIGPGVDGDAPALVGPDTVLTWGALRAHDKDLAPSSVLESAEANSLDLAARLITTLDRRGRLVLAHPKWPEALRRRALENVRSVVLPDNAATVLFTSGSTGAPKPVVHSLAAHQRSAAASDARLPFGPGDRWLLNLPLCHVGGLALLFRAAHRGGALAVAPPKMSLLDAISALSPTHISLVPTLLRRLLRDAKARAALSQMKAVLVGGGPLPGALIEAAQAADVPLHQTYGLTETASQVCTSAPGRPQSCGRPLEHIALRVRGGEIEVRGASLLTGYVEGGALVPREDDAWLSTGDLGTYDDDAGLHVVGRKDNRFVSGGENVQPESVEATFAALGHEVYVVPVADPDFGSLGFGFFRADLDTPAAQQTQLLASLARSHLADFMRPRGYHPLPPEAGLKPQRATLAELASSLCHSPKYPIDRSHEPMRAPRTEESP